MPSSTSEVRSARGRTTGGLIGAAVLALVAALALGVVPASAASRPHAPKRLVVLSTRTTVVSVGWSRVRAPGLSGYVVSVDHRRRGLTRRTRVRLRGLRCGARYLVTVRTRARHHRSRPVSVRVRTRACPASAAGTPAPKTTAPTATPPAGGGKPPAANVDRTRPAVPTGLVVGPALRGALPLSWRASTDNVGVASYVVSLDGRKAATTTATSYTFAGLTCATTHTLGVRAVDAAGNTSAVATVAGTTAACPPPPVCPANPVQGLATAPGFTLNDPASPCRTATGTVLSTHLAPDGSCRVNLRPVAADKGLLNGTKAPKPQTTITALVLRGAAITIPAVGSRVEVFATWLRNSTTQDNVLEPTWALQVLSGGPGACA